MCFSVSVQNNISTISIFREPKVPLWGGGGDRHMRAQIFFVRNSILNNFYLDLFLISCIFLAALSHKVKLIFHFYIHYKILNILIFGVPSSTHRGGGEIHICACGLLNLFLI